MGENPSDLCYDFFGGIPSDSVGWDSVGLFLIKMVAGYHTVGLFLIVAGYHIHKLEFGFDVCSR